MDMTPPPASVAMPPRLPETELANVKPIRGRFDKEGVFNTLRNFYDEDSIRKMQASGVDSRMVFGINSYGSVRPLYGD